VDIMIAGNYSYSERLLNNIIKNEIAAIMISKFKKLSSGIPMNSIIKKIVLLAQIERTILTTPDIKTIRKNLIML
jgi:hypothetical protein